MKLNLVLVDDSPTWLSITEKLALAHPLVEKVTSFTDSLDAWIYLQTHGANALMTDIEMPGMNGLSFLSMFSRKLPVISNSTKKGYALHASELGCTSFLAKPFSRQSFDEAIAIVHRGVATQ